MFPPRILSKNDFAIADLGIEVCSSEWTAPPGYESLVLAAWGEMRMRARYPIWDGTYYRVLNAVEFDGARMRLGTIRYRYIATFPGLQQHHAGYQLEPLHHLSTVALIRTSDGHYLFGKRTRDGSVDLIGGGVQTDELPVTRGADLERNLLKEMREEVGLAGDDICALTGIGVLSSATSNVIIVGHSKARLSKAEATDRFARRTEDEIAEPIFVSETALPDFLRGLTDYRKLIPELL